MDPHKLFTFLRHHMQIYPDMGVAAMLKNQWQDAEFAFASLSDRNLVSEDDDLIVLAAPDPQGMPCKSIALATTLVPEWTCCGLQPQQETT